MVLRKLISAGADIHQTQYSGVTGIISASSTLFHFFLLTVITYLQQQQVFVMWLKHYLRRVEVWLQKPHKPTK